MQEEVSQSSKESSSLFLNGDKSTSLAGLKQKSR